VQGLDSALLAVIVLELVHTTLSQGSLPRRLQELLAIGITSAVRSGLEIVAGAHAGERSTSIDLAVNALAVLLLVASLWLTRRRFGSDEGGA
jgi:phosphate starvation-inducible membrane PsiE